MLCRLLIVFTCCFMVLARGGNLTLDECLSRIGELDEIKERLQKLESISSVSRRLLLPPGGSVHSKVAFYSQLSKDVDHIGNHQTIVFDTVTTNIGGGYNPNDGIFTAPVTGTYVFFWLNTNRDHSYMNTELVRNSVVVGKSMSDAMDHIDYAASSNTAVLQLNEGEEVWVRSGTWHSAVVAGDFYSTYSGWLLYEG
ncbi:complement C1q tumor necrosis factor-related protein 3-like [Mercenaria mercenaria]|uniref:complement C1q tumor necrosis factor-related protein 3-like n=1 Tax=Mercenaria mercenaria TaxID=6596 RepID=UPI00234F56A7|nr:complement C1q tumor necrosis factor-related protein 3-like [Mercenaria mercenaria]